MRQRLTANFTHTALVSIAILLARVLACAQDVTEPSLKAAFIYSLAKFIAWPVEASDPKPFVICVLGDADVFEALEQSAKGRLLAGSSITVVRLNSPEPQPKCRLLYASGIPRAQVAKLLGALRGTPVLTISDLDGFTQIGGMVQFIFEHGQLRFSIGQESARVAGLKISAKILTLAIPE